MQFIFPKKGIPYILEKDWQFIIHVDFMNGFFLDFLTSEGLGLATFDQDKCFIKLISGTVISILSFDEKKVIFNVLKFSNSDEQYANLLCKVAIKEMKSLFLKDEDDGRKQNKKK